MFVDPSLISWLIIAAASICSFMIGISVSKYTREQIIEETIVYLIQNNFIKAKKVDGEWEILDLDNKE